jgi:hypothetical protein
MRFCYFSRGDKLVPFSARKQVTMSRSSTEAKYKALANATVNLCGSNYY